MPPAHHGPTPVASSADDPRSVRASLLALARRLLMPTEGESNAMLRIQIDQGTTHIELRSRPGELELLDVVAGLSEMESNIVTAMSEAGPGAELTAKQIAAAAGYAYSPRFRSAMKSLKDRGYIQAGIDGYTLSLGEGHSEIQT